MVPIITTRNMFHFFPVLLICIFLSSVRADEMAHMVEDISAEVKDDYYIITGINLTSQTVLKKSRWDVKGTYMAPCTSEEDCDAAFRMICKSGHCVCNPGDLFFEWPKYGCFSKVHMFGPCEVTGQCVAVNANTYCNPDNSRCTCSPNYFYNGRECVLRYDGSNIKAQEVYKAAVVAAACFIVAVVGIFVACIVRRSFCRREQNLQQSDSNTTDIFSISDEIAALRAVDKPPSYEEVLQIERTFYGIPPPEYSASRSGNSTAYQLPLGYASEQVNYLGLPYTSECTSTVPNVQAENPANENAELGKESEPTTSDNPSPIATSSHFLASAEVLMPPLSSTTDIVDSSPSSSGLSVEGPSRNIRGHFFSSTPPPCLRREHIKKPVNTSSSLPGSPLMSNHSEGPTLNLPIILRNELLKSDCQTNAVCLPTAPPLEDIPSSEMNTAANHSSNRDGACTLAYDNLGFVSDFHV